MVSTTTRTTEVWQARIRREFAAQLHADADVLGLGCRTDIVRAALECLHRRAAEQRMAQGVDEFYGDDIPLLLPIGVLPAEDDGATDPATVEKASGARGRA